MVRTRRILFFLWWRCWGQSAFRADGNRRRARRVDGRFRRRDPGHECDGGGRGVTRTPQTRPTAPFPCWVGARPVHRSVTYPGFASSRRWSVGRRRAGADVDPAGGEREKQEVTVQAEAGPSVSVEADNNAPRLSLKESWRRPDDPTIYRTRAALAGRAPVQRRADLHRRLQRRPAPPRNHREIRINQNPFSAEFDRLGFGRIEILTKPGTTSCTARYRYDSNAVFDFAQSAGGDKADYSNRMISGNLGAVSIKDLILPDFTARHHDNSSPTPPMYLRRSVRAWRVHRFSSNVHRAVAAHRLPVEQEHTLTVRFEERFNRGQRRPGRHQSAAAYTNGLPTIPAAMGRI